MNWNKIKHAAWFIPLIVALTLALITGVVFAVAPWNSANLKGNGTITVTTNPPPPPVQLSFTTGLNSDANPLSGSLSAGFTIVNNGIAGTTHTLTLASPTPNTPVTVGSYAFKLTASSTEQTTLTNYFAAKAGWTSAMQTQIDSEITGASTFFYLKYDNTGDFSLVDAFKQFLGSTYAPYPLTVDDDYPVGTYAYTGTIDAADGTSQTVTVTLIVTEPFVWEIGGNIVTASPSITLNFNTPSVAAGAPINVTATLGVTDVGSTAISGWQLGLPINYPSSETGWLLVVSQTPVSANGGTATLTFTLTGTAPATAGSINLNGVSCTLTPQ